jgi:hypothetical protein
VGILPFWGLLRPFGYFRRFLIDLKVSLKAQFKG